ncbi:MAG: DUF2784 domain-containing protein [Longimicrobiales bacterium]|nr:DUF2784 domain-containing protein [Longimicrobiales bacterium]
MLYSLLADAVLLFHFAFILFVGGGGLLVLRWERVIWLHLPVAVWGVWIELSGNICPLTPLENNLRRMAGEEGYAGGFIEHYLLPVIYPPGLTREVQFVIAALVVGLNLVVYGLVWFNRRQTDR